MAETSSLFGRLPPELIQQLLIRLPPADRLESRLVCKRWDALATIRQKFLVHVTDETVQASMNCIQKVETFYARDLQAPLPLSYRRKILGNLSHLQRVFFGPNVSPWNLKKLLEQVQQVTTLGFTHDHPPSFTGLEFKNLTCLQFQKIQLSKVDSMSFKKILSTVKFPSLRRFNLVQIDATDFRVYLAIHLFVVNHADTLRNLILNMAPSVVKNYEVDSRFRSLYESCEIYRDVSIRCADVRLDTLWINSCNFEGLAPWNLSCKLIATQNHLECLLMDGIWFSQAIQRFETLDIVSVLTKNQSHLKRLKLPLTELDGNLLNRCSKLEEFGAYIPFDQLQAFGLIGLHGLVQHVDAIPRSLKMIDMHIPMDVLDVQWLLRNIPLEDFVFQGLRHQFWTAETLIGLWACSIFLTSFRAYVRLEKSEMELVKKYLKETEGFHGAVEFSSNAKFALVDVNIIGRKLVTTDV